MSSDLFHLIKLLDDPDPVVKAAVETCFEKLGGDISESIAGEALYLSQEQRCILSTYLFPGRRRALEQAWFIPERFHNQDDEDWETFEFLLSLLSDYLHDGITLRPSLADSLDQLVDEVAMANAHLEVNELSRFLFTSGKFLGNRKRYFAKENSDMVWVMHNMIGNPISLVLIFMLVANRFGLTVRGCNYPGHFLAWVNQKGQDCILDPYNRARRLYPQRVVADNPNISKSAKKALMGSCSLKVILNRVLNNIEVSLSKEGLVVEVAFLQKLKQSLFPSLLLRKP